jgi:hypothetical protein
MLSAVCRTIGGAGHSIDYSFHLIDARIRVEIR